MLLGNVTGLAADIAGTVGRDGVGAEGLQILANLVAAEGALRGTVDEADFTTHPGTCTLRMGSRQAGGGECENENRVAN